MAKSLIDRMMDKVSPEPNSGCWIWTASVDHFGYGKLSTGNGWDRTHRISYRLHVGDIPKGKCVLHRCDNPHCCNPNHLFLGTRADNAADKAAKGRGNRKLKTEQVNVIRIATGTHQEIADHFGVNRALVTMIKNGNERKYL